MTNHAERRRTVSKRTSALKNATLIESLERRQLMSVNVTSWHNDASLTGLNPNEQVLTPANVKSATFGKLFSYPVAGQVYAQPLYVSNLAVPGQGTRNVVFVTTMNNDVYAFDANSTSRANGGVLWHVNLGPAAAVPSPFIGFRYGPDRDTTPLVGITSTPVIDLASGTMFIDSFTNDIPGQDAYSHHVHALDIRTGAEKVTPKLVTASVPGNGVGGNGSTVTFAANRQIQRSALTLHNGILYIAYAAYADTDPYHGWILGFDPSTLNMVSVLNTTPNIDAAAPDNAEGEGGIWQSGAGLASDGTHLYLETGNGDYNPTYGDYSDSVLRITTDSSTPASPNINGWGLAVTDYFTPYNEQALADADADLGSAGLLLLPDQAGAHPHEILTIGKQGVIYVLDRDNLGKHNATTDNVIQKIALGHGFWGSPAYFNQSVYYHAVNDVLRRYSITNGLLSAAPAALSTVTYPTWPGATPSVSSNGTANGIVWEVQFETAHQVLHAYDATTLTELFNSNQNASRDQMGAGVKFITPTVADGRVYVGSTGALSVYGLINPVTTSPAAPSGLTATVTTPVGVQLAWIDNADNEASFRVERSTDNLNWTAIATVGVDTRSYNDQAVNSNTHYYYRVCATNVIGDSAFSTVADVTTLPPTGATYVYHFDAGTGTSAVDSNNGNDGTLTGTPLPQWVAGHGGGSALSFAGGAVSTKNGLASVLGGSSTMTFWINTTQAGNNDHVLAPAIAGVEQTGGANDINWGTLDALGRIGLYVGNGGGVYSTARVNDGAWHHIAMTRDAASGRVQIFVDGVLNATHILDAGAKTTPFGLIGALTVAAADGTKTGQISFNGKLDEIKIYNAVLGANEIAAQTIVPGTPTLKSVTAMAGPVVQVVFRSPDALAGSIQVLRKVGVDGTFTPIATLSGGATTFDDTDVQAGVAYYYAVKASNDAGTSALSNVRGAMQPIPRVIGMYAFYNRSNFDGQNGSSNLTDRTAIASDKQPLLPGHTATFQNYTSYSRGLNGIIIDVADMDVLPRIDDFEFLVGNSSDTSTWTQAPTPSFINTYPGRGQNGSTQITIIWDDNVIQNEWLKVTVLAEPHLGLASNVTFYYGNAIGDTGDSTGDALVTSADASRVSSNQASGVSVENLYDINRDGVVNATDVALVNANQTGTGTPAQWISLGTAPTVATAAQATPAPVVATTTTLSVLASDAGGESGLTYTWTLIGTPVAPVAFSINGTNAARNTIATFAAAGSYEFCVTIANASGVKVTSLVTVQVNQTATTIGLQGSASIATNATTTYVATAFDQFGQPMAAQPTFTWSVSGGSGAITTGGAYTAPRTAAAATITAAAGVSTAIMPISVYDDVLEWYKADATAGATLADASSNAQTATLTGAYSWGGGVSGNAITFAGGYATLPAGIMSSSNDFTVATWVKVTTFATWARIFDFGSGTGIYMALIPQADSGAMRFAITNTGNGAEQRIDGPKLTANTWAHVAVTLSGNTATLFVNGVAVATNDAMTLHPTNLGATTQNYLGKSQFADPAFQGSLDDFRIYSRALSADQIAKLAEKGVIVATPATASPAPVTTKTTNLSVLGNDVNAGEAGLTYTWSTVGAVPAAVTFSQNGTNAAKNLTATFSAAGTYNFLVTIANAAGLSVTSTVTVVVNQTVSGVQIIAPSNTVEVGMTLPLSFGTVDQFGKPFGGGAVSGVSWTRTAGSGTVSASGVYTAPTTAGTATISASAAGVATATITLTIVSSIRDWYQANSTTGNTVVNAVTTTRNGTTNGAHTWSAGVVGNAINLTGGSVTVPDGLVSTLDDFTISSWVKVTTLANWARLFDFGSGVNSYMFFAPQAGNGLMRFAIKTAGNGEQVVDGPAMTANTWTHVAITLAGDVATLYVNGVAVGTNNAMTFHPADLGNTANDYLGRSQFAADPLLQGSIDDFRIYGRALTFAEVSQLAGPSIVRAAVATPGTIASTATSTSLSVIATDLTRGEAALAYTWSVLGTPAGSVTFAANGTNAAKNTTATFSSPGVYTLQVAASAANGAVAYSTVDVTVLAPNAVTSSAHLYETSPDRLSFTFNNDVGAAAFTAASLTVTRKADGALIPVTAYAYDAATRTATFTIAADLADGDYTAVLAKGTVLSTNAPSPFFILAGDVNHDRTVDFADLLILAKNYNTTGRTFSQGNVDRDATGAVNFSDLLILAKHYNTGLPTLASAASVSATSGLVADSTPTRKRTSAASALGL